MAKETGVSSDTIKSPGENPTPPEMYIAPEVVQAMTGEVVEFNRDVFASIPKDEDDSDA